MLLSLLEHQKLQKKLSVTWAALGMSLLVLYAGLRSSQTGEDYDNYLHIFQSFKALSSVGLSEVLAFDYFFEPGFALFIAVVKSFSLNHEFFFFVTALVNCFIFYRVSTKLTPFLLLTWLSYFSYIFFTHGLVAIRYGIASVIGLYVIIYLSEKRYLKSLLVTFGTMMFHTAAVALLVPIFFSFIRFTPIKFTLFIVVSFAFGALGLGDTIVSTIFPSWLPRAESAVNYMTSEKFGESLGFLGLINLKNIILSALFILAFSQAERKYSCYYYLIIFFIAGVCLRLAFHDLGFIIGRISMLLTLTEVFLVPMAMFSIFKNNIASWFFVVFYGFINMIMMLHVRGFGEYNSIVF